MSQDNKNWFVRILIIFYVLFLVGLIIFSFLKKHPPFEINSGIIFVLLIATILILSEGFNNLSIGKIFSLKRKINDKEEKIKQIKKENYNLRENIIKITSNITQNQTQSNTTFNGMTTQSLRKILGVTKAEEETEEELDEKDKWWDEEPNNSDENKNRISRKNRRKYRKIAEEKAIDKFLDINNFSKEKLIREAVFKSAFQDLDPIMEGSFGARFDGYINLTDKEIFIEVWSGSFISPTIYYRFYTMLSKLYFYSEAKETKTELILIFANMPEEMEKDMFSHRKRNDKERFIEKFQPAISNNLLRIKNFDFTNEDLKDWDDIIDLGEDESN